VFDDRWFGARRTHHPARHLLPLAMAKLAD